MRRMVAKTIDTTNFRGRVADALRRAMIEEGIQQKDLAEKLNVAPEVVSQMLSGKRNMTLDKVNELMKAIGRQVTIF